MLRLCHHVFEPNNTLKEASRYLGDGFLIACRHTMMSFKEM